MVVWPIRGRASLGRPLGWRQLRRGFGQASAAGSLHRPWFDLALCMRINRIHCNLPGSGRGYGRTPSATYSLSSSPSSSSSSARTTTNDGDGDDDDDDDGRRTRTTTDDDDNGRRRITTTTTAAATTAATTTTDDARRRRGLYRALFHVAALGGNLSQPVVIGQDVAKPQLANS